MHPIEYSEVKTGVIGTIIVWNIVTNCLLIAVLLKYTELREDRTALFVISLSLADLGIGLCLPTSAALCSNVTSSVQHMTRHLPKVNIILIWFFGFISQHSQAWVALSKMVSVLKPLRYEQLISRNRCYGIIVCIWIVSAALAASRLVLATTWNMNFCMYIIEANNISVSALSLFLYVLSSIVPQMVLLYATVRNFLVVVRAHSHVSAQVQSISGGADVSGMVTLKAIRSARNVLVICFVALALSVPVFMHMVIRHILYEAQALAVFSFVAIWLFFCNSFTNSFLYMFLHRSIRHKLRLMFTGVYESCRCR